MSRLPFCLSLAPCLILVRTKCIQVSGVRRGSALDSSRFMCTEVHLGAPGSEFLLGRK